MSGPGPFTVSTPVAAPTAPTSLPFVVGSAITPSFVWRDHGRWDALVYPGLKAVCFANGMDFQYHVLDGVAYLTGPKAPKNAPTLVSTAVRATATWVTGTDVGHSDLANNDTMSIRGKVAILTVKFVTTLTPGAAVHEVKRGTSLATTISNFTKMINGTGTDGVEYTLPTLFGSKLPNDYWYEFQRIEVTGTATDTPSSGQNTTTLRARDYGTGGNSYALTEGTDSGVSWSVTTFAGGTAGTGTAPASGTYRGAYANFRSPDGAQSARSPEATVTQDGNFNLTFSGYDTPATRDAIDFFRIFRTTVSGSQFYRVAEDASSPYTDSSSDDTLRATLFSLYGDDTSYRLYQHGYPERYRVHAFFKGCVFGAGADLAAQYSLETASVTVGSDSVTLAVGARPKTDWIGRIFQVAADAGEYRILEVVESTRVLTLERNYEGATNATASYTVTDKRNPCEILWSEPQFLNNWPVDNSEEGVQTSDPHGIVGLVATEDSLLAFTRTNVGRVTGEPEAGFSYRPAYEGMGLFNQSCALKTSGAVYWLGPDGAFGVGATGEPKSISEPEGGPTGIAGTLARINTAAANTIVGNYNPSLKVLRWWVPLDGSPYNTHVLCYSLQTGAWTTDECGPVTAAANVDYQGVTYTLIGDVFGTIWQADLGVVDGAFGFIPVQALSTYTASTRAFACSGTPAFPTTSGGLRGCPFYVKSPTGIIERFIVASNTSSALTATAPATLFTPTAADQVIVGDIFVDTLTCRTDFGIPESDKTAESVTIGFTPDAGQLWAAAGVDSADPSFFLLRSSGLADAVDLSSSDGKKQIVVRRGKGSRVQLRICGFAPDSEVEIIDTAFVVRMRDPNTETIE